LDVKEIKQIIDIMKRSGLTEFEIEEEGLKMRICRNANGNQPQPTMTAAPYPAPVQAYIPQPEAAPAPAPAAAAPAKEDADAIFIKSPMVGTFYRAPSPESPSFVKEGDRVNSESVVCILEAMKVMNEIHAEVSGVIQEILIENGESVEYGQPLFKLKKA